METFSAENGQLRIEKIVPQKTDAQTLSYAVIFASRENAYDIFIKAQSNLDMWDRRLEEAKKLNLDKGGINGLV